MPRPQGAGVPVPANLSRRIDRLHKASGMTWLKLAFTMGLSKRCLMRWKTGENATMAVTHLKKFEDLEVRFGTKLK